MEVSSPQPQGGIYEGSGMESSPSHRVPVSEEQTRAIWNREYPSTSSAFSASAHPDEDWTKVSDLAERRRIQNRIAQRNYRKKIKERMADLERRAGGDGSKKSPRRAQEKTDEEIDTETHQKSRPAAYEHFLPPPRVNIAIPIWHGDLSPHSSAPPAAGSDRPPHVEHGENESSLPKPGPSTFPIASHSQEKVVSPPDQPLRSADDLLLQPVNRARSSSPPGHTLTQGRRRQSISGVPSNVIALRLVDGELGDSSAGPKRVQKHPATFQCSLCPKRFTRAYNLRSHLRTHTDEKPFVCTVCGKAFARQHDRKRHESLHSGEKSLVCKGDLEHGGQWGCGRRFARADALGRHFRSEAGSICIRPLQDEENIPKHPENSVAVGNRLPAALFAQYPALALMNWEAQDAHDETTDRSRFDASDYESDDAGYVSGTETGFGETNDWLRESSFHDSGRAVVDSPDPLPGSQEKVDDTIPSDGSPLLSRTPHDQPSATDTGETNLGQQSLGHDGLRPETYQNQSQVHPQQVKQHDVNDPEVLTQGASDISDDNMSLRSFTESVFDVGSVVSSASSSHSNSSAMVASFVDILLRDPNMDRLLAITTSEFGVTSGRFTRNFSRILKSYSRHLRQAIDGYFLAKDVRDEYLMAAKAVCNARHQVSNLIASRYNERVPTAQDFKHRDVDLISRHLNQPLQTDNDDPSSNGESSGDEVDFTITDVKQFLVSGEPFSLLKRNLRSLVIPDEFLDCVYESVLAFLDMALADRRIRSVVHGLRHRLLFGDKQLEPDLTKCFRLMAAEVRTECTDVTQLDASIFLATYAEYISVIAIDLVNTTFTTSGVSGKGSAQMHGTRLHRIVTSIDSMDPNDRATKAATPHEDVLERLVAGTLPSVLYVDLVPHWTFLASSAAFSSLADALRDLAYPTFFSEARKSVRTTIRSAESSENKLLALEGQRLLPILAEMESCLQKGDTGISFSINPSKVRMTALDRVKLAIEASTAAQWDWWPLQPPNRLETHDRAELSWQCPCGIRRHESTVATYARELQSMINKFPLSRVGSSAPIDRSMSSLSNTSSQGDRSTQSADSSSANSSVRQSTSSSSSTLNSAITLPDDGDDSVVDFSNGARRYIYVFLLVKASEYTLDTIDVSAMKARDFFQALRATYKKRRGIMRRAFSIFVYNHCDFIKIMKPEPETFMPGELKFELPADHDDEYHYRPRPTYSAPITRHMFRHYFYGCYENGTLLHRLHTCLPMAPTCRIRNPAAEILEYFPKRDRPVAVAAQSDKVEVCYGIAARQCRSFFRVLVYLCLIMAPAFWFVFAWLFVWGDRGDLQDATIPMTLVLSMLSILWAVVYSGSDVRKEYGDGSS